MFAEPKMFWILASTVLRRVALRQKKGTSKSFLCFGRFHWRDTRTLNLHSRDIKTERGFSNAINDMCPYCLLNRPLGLGC
jgi:hypothetical protein